MWRFCAIAVAVALICGAACGQRAQNPITNGSFEKLGPDGFPVDWERVGLQVSVTQDAHSGRYAVLLHRTQEAIERKLETGLNRAWRPHSGEQGAMLAQRKGAVRFWYKVPAADRRAALRFYIIPMSADPLENTGAARQFAEVPVAHYGDGQWHMGIVAYDFTDVAKCKWVQVSPRIVGNYEAQWILDDVEWIETAGPIAQIRRLQLEEVKGREGELAKLVCLVANVGDKPLTGRAVASVPEGLKIQGPAEISFGPIHPGRSERIEWTVAGLRSRPGVITVTVRGGAVPATANLPLEPQVEVLCLQADRFVVPPGDTIQLRLVARNTGNACAEGLRLTITGTSPGLKPVGPGSATLPLLRPGLSSDLSVTVRAANRQLTGQWVRARWSWQGKSGEVACEGIIIAPPPDRAAEAVSIRCRSFEIVFPHCDFGWGLGYIYSLKPRRLLGVIPYLARAATAAHPDPVPLYARSWAKGPSLPPLGLPLPKPAGIRTSTITFTLDPAAAGLDDLPGPIRVAFVSAPNLANRAADTITWHLTAPASARPYLRLLEGPPIYAGEGSFGGEQDEALLPGLEWLVRGEHSSSDLDIAADHPDRIRYVPHPHKITVPLMAVRNGRFVVGLLWHPRAAFCDGRQRPNLPPDQSDVDRPSAFFASPDYFEGRNAHAMGLFIPTVPGYVEENSRTAKTPWPAHGVNPRRIHLVAAIYATSQADTILEALRAWRDVYGLVPPRRLPHAQNPTPTYTIMRRWAYTGDWVPDWLKAATPDGRWNEPTRREWIDEIEHSMVVYLKTLWVDEEKGWMSTWGGPAQYRRVAPHPGYWYDMQIAEMLTDDPNLRQQLRQRLDLLRRLYPMVIPRGDDMGFHFGTPTPAIRALVQQAQSVARSQDPDGGWRFHPYIATGGVFKGRDYHELGYEGQEAVGLCARKAWMILRAARMTGDESLLRAGLRALRYMDKFIVPRAAQVWEVPVHTPDILASSDACQAYIEAFRITGDRRFLEKAVYWLETGLPFLYQWDVDAFPMMRYGSIPVFGATWMRGAWFRRLVQWNGLRWAYSALELAEYDHSYPWRMLAAGVTISALYQMENDPSKPTYGLWPDSYNVVDGTRSGWQFAPRQILKNIYKLLGYEPEPHTTRVRAEGGDIIITAAARIEGARLEGEALQFTLVAPPPISSRIFIANIAEPQRVEVAGTELPRRRSLPAGRVIGWTYYPTIKALEISPGEPGELPIAISPARFTRSRFVAPVLRGIRFEFDTDDGFWVPANHLEPFQLRDGLLITHTTGVDPYMIRSNCEIDGSKVARIHIRMAVGPQAGTGAQWYWATEDSPTLAEDKVVRFEVINDGKFHDYYIDVGKHKMWRGHKITTIRLDPASGGSGAEVKIDFIRGLPPEE